MDKIAGRIREAGGLFQPGEVSQAMGVFVSSAGLALGRYPYHCRERVREDYLLLLTVEGRAAVEEDGQKRELGPGDWFLLAPSRRHSYYALTSWSLAYVHVHGWLVESLLANLGLLGKERLCFRQQTPAAADILDDLVHGRSDAAPGSESRRNALALQLLPVLAHDYAWPSAALDRWARLEAHIARNLRDKLTLGALAAEAHMSRHHFCRMFRRSFGETPLRYVQKLRMERAMNLFKDNADLRVDEVAARVGLSDPLHFSRLFRRWTGLSPSAFRRRLREEFIG